MALRSGLYLSVSASLFPLAALAADPVPVTALDAVTTTATRTQQSVADAAAAVTVIGREEIEREQPQTVGDLLEDIPGVTISGGTRSSAQSANIRGMSDDRIVTTIDGARKTFNAGHKGRFFLDPYLLKEVDVQRGPNSVLYGSGALGGVINMRTKDAADFLRPGETWGGVGTVGFQSANAQRMASMTAFARPVDAVDLLASVTRRHDGNTRDGNGDKVPFSGDDIGSGMVKGSVKLGDGHSLGLMGMQFRDTLEAPSNADGETVTASNPLVKRKTAEDTIALNWALAPSDMKWLDAHATLHQTNLSIEEDRKGVYRRDQTKLQTQGIDLSNTSRFSTAGVGHALTYGIDYLVDQQKATRNGAARDSYPRANQDTFGAFAQNEVTLLPVFSVIVGGRYDRIGNEREGRPDVTSEHFSPQATVKITPAPWLQLWGTYAEAFRAPSLTELYVGGQHYPGNIFVANPDLKPETAHNKEVGVNLKFDDVFQSNDKLRAKVSAYANSVDNFIDQVVGPTTTRNLNVGKADIKGVEAEASYDMTTVFASLGAAHIEGEDSETGAALSSIPADKLTLMLGGRWVDADLDFGWRGTMVGSQKDVPTGGMPTGGYALHDLFAGWTPSDGPAEGTRIQFAVDNLFDKSYRPHLASTRDPGRNLKLTVSRQF